MPGQPGSQFTDDLLAILSAIGTLLFLLEDTAANLVVRVDLKQVGEFHLRCRNGFLCSKLCATQCDHTCGQNL
jgi:hypothetical protein